MNWVFGLSIDSFQVGYLLTLEVGVRIIIMLQNQGIVLEYFPIMLHKTAP